MTKKLYYDNPYLKSFTAKVVSVSEKNGKYVIALDKTAFFPEEAGQSADTGYINGQPVLSVFERDGIIEHTVDKPLSVGDEVSCTINFDERFDKMQNHTAEHIVSGLFHKLYGLDNVGFHLGRDEVTVDLNGVLSREELDRVELLANRAVFENIPIEKLFPSAEELKLLEYRSKLDLTENVRIVNIGEYDSCACCAPHVRSTGEIGLIKLLDFMKHRGGIRIRMLAGERALNDYREKFSNALEISSLLCVPQNETARGLRAYMASASEREFALKRALSRIVELEAEKINSTDSNFVCYLDGLSLDEARELVNIALPKVGGVLVALVGNEGNYRYVMASENADMREICKSANSALSGKGGGKPPMMQGSFAATLSEIEDHFLK